MAINKKLIHFKTKQKFNEELAKGNILNTSIVFIQETLEIYTHGLYYTCKDWSEGISNLLTQINTLVSGDASTAIESFNEIIAFLENIEDSESLDGIIAGIESQIATKQDKIIDLETIRSGAAKGATALLSYTETDPVFKASVAAGIKASDITNWNSKTSNTGTITGIKMNGDSKGTSGVVDLGTVITAHQDISGKLDSEVASATYLKKTDAANTYLPIGDYAILVDTEEEADDPIINSGGSSSGGAYAEVNHGTSDTTFALTPNTFHVWDEVSSLDLSFADEQVGVANEYLFQFTSGATATTLTLPDGLKWANDTPPTIAENMIYQVSVLKGLASVLEFINPKIVIIEFSINSTTYQAEEGMTWEEWLNSKYNTDVFYPDGSGYVSHPNGNYYVVTLNGIYEDITNTIIKNINYTTSR